MRAPSDGQILMRDNMRIIDPTDCNKASSQGWDPFPVQGGCHLLSAVLVRSAQEITQDYLDRLQAAEPQVQSFISVASQSACAAARALDDSIASDGMDSLGPLAAVPLGIKVGISRPQAIRLTRCIIWCLRITHAKAAEDW